MRYTEEMRLFIKDNVKGNSAIRLAALFNGRFGTSVTPSMIKSYKKNYHLTSETKCGINDETPRKVYPLEVIAFIKDNHKGTGYSAMAEKVNDHFGTSYTKNQMKHIYGRFHLDSGLTGRFEKGHVPILKGKHLVDVMTPEQIEKMKATQFKPGQRCKTWVPVGTERKRKSSDGYTWVKIAEPNIWEMKQRVQWRKHHGEIPSGMMVCFLDGDKDNYDIDNLYLVTKEENGHLNITGARQLSDSDITKGSVLTYRLERLIKEKTDEADNGGSEQCTV